jgi:hypothetical protein
MPLCTSQGDVLKIVSELGEDFGDYDAVLVKHLPVPWRVESCAAGT